MMWPVDLGIMDVPLARRATAPGWRDPRLWIGLAIVAACVVAGGLVLGSSDDTVPVWAAAGSLGAGHVLTADDLAVRRVHFDDPAAAALYFRADQRLPAELQLSRDVGAGELVPRAALAPAPAQDVRDVPVSVAPDQVPARVRVGDSVDVYVRPAARTSCQASSVCDGLPALSDVTVVDDPPADQTFGSDGTRMLVLGMSAPQARHFFRLLATTDGAALTVVGRD
jgi:hypothetical protein